MEWIWPAVDEGRVKRARTVKFTETNSLDTYPAGKAAGSASEDYDVTLASCTCKDFSISKSKSAPLPCKHMIALAMKAGILNENGLTPAQQKQADISAARDQLAMAYGYYYLFRAPIMTDAEYDALRRKLHSLEESM